MPVALAEPKRVIFANALSCLMVNSIPEGNFNNTCDNPEILLYLHSLSNGFPDKKTQGN